MDKLFIFLLCFYFGSAKVRINDLKVPQSIESGTVHDVILDCDFEANDEPGVVVKWFLNGGMLIYQWIPEINPPQAVGAMKYNIDASYKISNDRNTMYRALRIINVRPELSGNYSCKVIGENSEDIQTKSMIIYEPLDGGLSMHVSDVESAITCEGSGIYPKPNMTLYITNENQTETIFQEDVETLEFDESGFYNVSSVLYFTPENLTGIIHYICELTIAGTDYKERIEDILILRKWGSGNEIEERLNLINSSNSADHYKETQANRSTSTHMPNVLSTILLMLLAIILRL